jgi:hypothetical protein
VLFLRATLSLNREYVSNEHAVGDLLNKTLKSVSTYIGLVLTIFGFIACVMGFGDAVNAGWGTSFAIRGFSELLFGISFMLLGNVLVALAKR